MGILEVVPECPCALDSGVGQGADFFAVEPAPFLAIEFIIEGVDELGMNKINESIAHIAGVIVVDGKVKEVKFDFEVFIELFQKQLLGVFVGDVSNHEGSSAIILDLHVK